MNQQAVAIIIAGVLIATAVALTNHWAFDPGGYLLNRWTGTVVVCTPNLATREMSCPAQSK
jgi:hypothetical protein